jgi:hypothetical protein
MTQEPATLYEFTREEWLAVTRYLKPEITEDEFDVMWEEFQVKKRQGPPQ